MLTEPHYKLKFLSWSPRRWRSPYLRLMGKGTFYDCEPQADSTICDFSSSTPTPRFDSPA